jgi:CRISPR-associated protein Csx10
MIHLLLTLESDLVLSSRPGSTGQHECLDFIPGSALWGAVAARFYGRWAQESSWDKNRAVFHEGRVRFGCGLPASPAQSPMLPIPFSWHHAKGEKGSNNNCILANNVTNLAAGCSWDFDKKGQPKQMREGWFDMDGRFFETQTSHRLKTAIDASKFDSAKESQLFGYTAICAGQSFIATVEGDPSTPGWPEIEAFLSNLSSLHLGRSRTAEFGRISVRRLSAEGPILPASGTSPDGLTRLHLLSDVALTDGCGLPQLLPTALALGLGEGALVPEQTHLRFRSYSPWNRFRGCYDTERQVISAGSVITLKLARQPEGGATLRAGLHQAEGLGVLTVNPPYLLTPQPAFAAAAPAQPSKSKAVPAPLTLPVYQVMMRRHADRTIEQLAAAIGREWADEWKRGCGNISKSQWARVRQAAVAAHDSDGLLAALGEIFEHGLSAEGQWKKSKGLGGSPPRDIVRRSITDIERLTAAMREEHLEPRDANGRDLVGNLTLQATREASIAISRMKGSE